MIGVLFFWFVRSALVKTVLVATIFRVWRFELYVHLGKAFRSVLNKTALVTTYSVCGHSSFICIKLSDQLWSRQPLLQFELYLRIGKDLKGRRSIGKWFLNGIRTSCC